MIYVDTSALVKQIRIEPESSALADWLDQRLEIPWITSVLAEIELPRAIRSVDPDGLPFVGTVLARLNRFEIDPLIRQVAAAYRDPALRSLDAIHLATAQKASAGTALTAFVTYDRRLAAAARAIGLAVAAPGSQDTGD